MPTERFFRLPKKKADTIRKAAIAEFKRVKTEDASINKIIQTAEISRGSFYTYFEDKYDLLKWVMGDYIEEYRQFYITELKKNGGDLWDVFERVLGHTIQWVDDQGLVEIVGNMMRGNFFTERIQQNSENVCQLEVHNEGYIEQVYQYVDQKCCELNLTEFRELMGMHFSSLVFALKTCFADNESLEVIQASYRRRMKLLRYGACSRLEQAEID